MTTKRRNLWGSLLVAALGVWLLAKGVDYYVQEPPNYSLIEDGLWMGGKVPQPPPGSRAVLNLCAAPDSYEAETCLWEPIEDSAPAPSLDWLRRVVEFIDQQRHAGKVVYVHCQAGVSRSGLVVTAYLMFRLDARRSARFRPL